jgi:AraC-like DNA-binding protein
MLNYLETSFNKLTELYINDYNEYFTLNIQPGGFCRFDLKTPTNGKHYHTCYELCIVLEGSGFFTHDGITYPVKKNDIFIANPKVIHEIFLPLEALKRTDNKMDLIYFLIHLKCSEAQSSSNEEYDILCNFLKDHKVLISALPLQIGCICSILNSIENSAFNISSQKQLLKISVLESLSMLACESSSKYSANKIQHSIIDDAIKYIGKNITKKLSVEEIASEINVAPRTLQYHFQKKLNRSLIDYISERRMTVAASYLRMNFKVTEVCERIGIQDPAQFSRTFKKYYSISPKKYQRSHGESELSIGALYKDVD